jgi:hypothetical protein
MSGFKSPRGLELFQYRRQAAEILAEITNVGIREMLDEAPKDMSKSLRRDLPSRT